MKIQLLVKFNRTISMQILARQSYLAKIPFISLLCVVNILFFVENIQ